MLQSCRTEKEGKGTGTEKGEDDNSNLMKEWQIARDVLSKFDEHLHDLRKYGFGFITALLAAESLLIPVGSSTALPNIIKVAVLTVTLTLIVALHLLDHLYRIIQGAAAIRASILEKALNLELTDVIKFKFGYEKAQRNVGGVYFAFTLGVLILGLAILGSDYLCIVILVVVALVALALIYRIGPHYTYGAVDWRIDRLVCSAGEKVGITLTNLDDTRNACAWFRKGTIMWAITREGDTIKTENDRKKAFGIFDTEQDFSIDSQDSYTWLWQVPGKIDEGIYRVHRTTVKPIIRDKLPPMKPVGEPNKEEELPLKPLKRKLRVIRKVPAEKEGGTNKAHPTT